MFDAIEKLKREFTDQYVQVDAKRPELARFSGLTGQVKTVNMSGRALVQFDAWNNIGWYDIGLDFLKVVPKPEPKPVEEKAKKPATAKPQTSADSPAVAPKPVASAATGEKKPSVAEMLRAQAAAKKAGGEAPAAAPAAAAPAPSPEPGPEAKVEASPKKEEPKPAAPTGEKKLSTAEILAALRKKP